VAPPSSTANRSSDNRAEQHAPALDECDSREHGGDGDRLALMRAMRSVRITVASAPESTKRAAEVK
jgi:hypothetical protein